MENIIDIKKRIAKHCDNNFRDVAAISLAQFILVTSSNKRIMPNLETMDKWPSTDGYLELQNENGVIGRIDVQVKTLPSNHDYKFDIPIPFLAYVDIVSIAPCLLLLVEVASKKIFWVHISKEYIDAVVPDYYKNEKTCRIKFNKMNIVSETEQDFLSQWESIIGEYQTRIRSYNSQRELASHLQKFQNEAIGKDSSSFIPIHVALDYLEHYLSSKFEAIKRISFPNAWKIGIALTKFTPSALGYMLYPIYYDTNDVQIKFADENIYNELYISRKHSITNHSNNPILDNPRHFALMACIKLFHDSINNYLLRLPRNKILIQEIFESLINKYFIPLGLEIKLEYTEEELQYAFRYYIPLWIDAAIEYLSDSNTNTEENYKTGEHFFLDPLSLYSKIDDKTHVLNILKRLIEHKAVPKHMPIGSKNIPLHLAYDLLRTKLDCSVSIVYPQFNRIRCSENGNYIFNLLTQDQLVEKVKLVYSSLPETYDEFVSMNFGNSMPELLYYYDCDLVIIEIKLKDIYLNMESPTIYIYYLSSPVATSKQIKICENIIDYSCGIGETMVYDGISFEVIRSNSSVLNSMFHDYPMLNILYLTLESRLSKYIKEMEV